MTREDVIWYAIQLATGDALTVRRVAEYTDYNESLLNSAIAEFNGTYSRNRWVNQVGGEHTHRGILVALTRARADAADRAYRRRNRGSR